MGKTNLIKVLLHFYLLVKENDCTIIKRKNFGLCPKGSVILWLNGIGNHYYKAVITVTVITAENLPSKLDLHCTAPTQLRGVICSSTYSLMWGFLPLKNVKRLKKMFYNHHSAAGRGNTLSRKPLEAVSGESFSYKRLIYCGSYFQKPACHITAFFFSFPWPFYVQIKLFKCSHRLLDF